MAYFQNPYMQNPYAVPYEAPKQQNNGLVWVQGEAGAKSYLVAPSSSVLLMDSENSRFYIKSADASGMPLQLRVFEYSEVKGNEQTANPIKEEPKYVTHEELEEALAKLKPKKEKKDAE